MQTPQKKKKTKRFLTTAATQKNDTIFRTWEDEIQSKVHGEYSFIAKKIHFQSQQQKICKQMTRDQAKLQANYRKKMISYLNGKFGDAIAQINKESQPNSKIINATGKDQYDKMKEKIKYAFKQFIYNARQQRCSYLLSEYDVGSILKAMSFLQKLLQERHIILKICSQLEHLTITSLFMFILQFHTLHLQTIKQEMKNKVIQLIRFLFQEQGFKQSLINLQRYLSKGEIMSKKQQFTFMRFNRQKRPTSSSISYSLNRNK